MRAREKSDAAKRSPRTPSPRWKARLAVRSAERLRKKAMPMNWLTGFHAVEEALAAGRALDRILVAKGRHGERVEAVVQLAKAKGVPVRFEDRLQIARLGGTRGHPGGAAGGGGGPGSG